MPPNPPAEPGAPARDFELILHVGHPKTATTWLQETLFEVPGTGFVVPWPDARARAIEAFVTVNPYRRDPCWARAFFEDGLRGLADPALVPVLSDETLVGDPFPRRYTGRDVADRLHEAFPRARVLIGVREQASMAISCYRESLLQGATWDLEDFIGTGRESLGYSPVLRPDFLAYDLVVAYYQGLYGAANVLVLPIERLRRDRAAFLRDIYDFCGCPARPEVGAGAEARHVGASALALAARRALNPLVRTSPLRPGHLQAGRRAVGRVCAAIDRLPRRWSEAAERRWKAAVARRYEGAFGASNRRLAELTGLDLGALGYDVS